MAEALAHNKFSCPACGAEATWNPAKKALVCAFCGTTSPANIELAADGKETIVEHDLIKALRSIPDSARGWDAQKTEVKCQSCQAISVFDPERVGQRRGQDRQRGKWCMWRRGRTGPQRDWHRLRALMLNVRCSSWFSG